MLEIAFRRSELWDRATPVAAFGLSFFRRFRASASLLLAALPLAATVVSAPTASAEPRFTISGSTAVGDRLMPALVEGYTLSRGLSVIVEREGDPSAETLRALFGLDPVFTVDLVKRGSTAGLKALIDGEAAVAMSSRRARASEATAEGLDLYSPEAEHVLALDALAVVVAPSNPLASISLQEVARIFSGQITDWRELGLPAGPIAVHSRSAGAGALDGFTSMALAPYDATILEGAPRHASDEDLVAAVAADPAAIGFASIGFVETVRAVPIILSCGVIAPPDAFSAKAEEYPLSRRLFLYAKPSLEPPAARALMEFALSDQAQPIIARAGMVDLEMRTQGKEGLSSRLINAIQAPAAAQAKEAVRRFVDVARGASRLSTTFRFAEGDLLDAKAFDDAGRLARWLERPENARKTVTLIGFTDSSRAHQTSLSLAAARAEAVRRSVLIQISPTFDPARLKTDAFGGVAPVACDDTEAGRLANSRVEVWISQ